MSTPRMRQAGRVLALFVLFVAVSPGARAVDFEEALEVLENQVLVLEITARVTENGRETVWNMELTEVTVSGRAVHVELEGHDLVVHVQFTPYERDDSIVLVAQGQAWLGSGESQEVTYRSAYDSMPVSPGETVVFFPLGTSEDSNGDGDDLLNLELEISIERYTGGADVELQSMQ